MLLMISPARRPSRTMLLNVVLAASTSGVSLASQRKPALPFETMAANG